MDHSHHPPEGEPSDHPSESVLAAYLDNELSDEERSRLELHLDQCIECRRALAETVAVLDSTLAGVSAVRPDVSAIPPRRRQFRWVALGGALAASLAAVVVLRRPPGGTDDAAPRTRDAAPSVTDERLPRLIPLAPNDGATGVDEHPSFTWGSAGVDRYSFRLLAEDGVPIWSRETSDTVLALPSDVRLERGRSYFWRVDALSAGIVASTRAQRFTVSR